MISARSLGRMTEEQQHHMSMMGVRANELKRLASEPPIYSPIREGLQLAAFFLDFRAPQPRANHILLFDEPGYHNRYSWVMNNNEKDGLIGWHKAVRHAASHVRPMLHASQMY